MADAARTWDDALSDALVGQLGDVRGHELARRYAGAVPRLLQVGGADLPGQFDVEQFERLGPDRPYVVALQNEHGTAEPLTRLKLYKTGGKAPLSDLLPLLEALGLTVVEEVPTRLQEHEGSGRYLHDFGVLGPARLAARPGAGGGHRRRHLRRRLGRRGRSGLAEPAGAGGRPDLAAGGDPARLPAVPPGAGRRLHLALRNDAFVRNSELARKLVELFEQRLDPERGGETNRRRSRPTSSPAWTASPAWTTTASCAASSA